MRALWTPWPPPSTTIPEQDHRPFPSPHVGKRVGHPPAQGRCPPNFSWYADIANFRHPQVQPNKANQISFTSELIGRKGTFTSLFDTGSFNAIDYNFATKNGLPLVPLPWSTPVSDFAGQSNNKATINYGCLVPLKIGSHHETVPCLVSWISPSNPVVLGMQWFRTNCPEMVTSLLKLGGGNQNPAPRQQTIIAASAHGQCYAVGNQDRSTVLLAAISSEENRRDELTQKFIETVALRAAVIQETDDRIEINGLSRNIAGWEKEIPARYHPFVHTVFSDEEAQKLPPLRPGTDAEVRLKENERLWQCKLIDLPQNQLEALRLYLDEQLHKGFIQPSHSPVASPVFFVKEPGSDSRGKPKLRLVVDYRTLNTKIDLDEYPIPLTRQVMDKLGSAKIFTKFDVRTGFNNIRVKPGDEWKLAFKTMFGLYEYKVMPMGLATAPSIFQRFINSILSPFLGIFCYAYLDDIVIFSENPEEHAQRTTQVLEALEKAGLHLKPSKCAWDVTRVNFLGYTAVAGKGVCMSDDKIQAIRNWEKPLSLSDIRSFVGLANFYSKFVPHYADTMKPFYELTKKGATYFWNDILQSAFNTIKTAMRNDVFLLGFNYEKDVTLETDASGVAYAGIISQTDEDGNLRPVLMYSHTFSTEQINWDTHDRELWAIVYAFKTYPHFLKGTHNPVNIFSDHRNLSRFMTTADLTLKDRHRRWATFLTEYNFIIRYRPGEENAAADALSRYNLGDSILVDLPLLPSWRFEKHATLDPAPNETEIIPPMHGS
jgi:hypothetical protein